MKRKLLGVGMGEVCAALPALEMIPREMLNPSTERLTTKTVQHGLLLFIKTVV